MNIRLTSTPPSPTPASQTATWTTAFASRDSILQPARRRVDARHRVHGVENQVEQYLLQLDAIAEDRRQIAGEVGLERHVTALQVAAREHGDVLNQGVDIERRRLDGVVLEQLAVAADHLVRPLPRFDDIRQRRADLGHVGRLAGGPAQAGFRVHHDGGQWLADLVRDRGGELPERRQPRHAGQLRLGLVQLAVERLRSVMSVSVPMMRTGLPAFHCTADPRAMNQRTLPSLCSMRCSTS